MIELDKWEALEQDESLDKDTVLLCKELAFSMCRKIFDTLSLDARQADDTTLVVSGRGLRYVFQVRSQQVKTKILGDLPVKLPPAPRKRGRPLKEP